MKTPSSGRALLEAIAKTADAVYAVDSAQRIVFWSPRAEDLFGVPAAEVLGRRCHEVVRGERGVGTGATFPFCEKDCATICASREGRAVPAYDIVHTTPDGRRVWMNLSIIPLGAEDAGEALAVHLCRDVSERRRAEAFAQRVTAAYQAYVADGGGTRAPAEGVPLAARGGAWPPPPSLTTREREILQHLARGEDTRHTADSLGIAAGTLRNHVSALMRKLGARSRLEVVLRAGQAGLL